MVNIKNTAFGIVGAFLFAVILSGAVSATTVHFSSDGKNISVTDKYVNSTLNTYVTGKTGTGAYGYGKYMLITSSGKDNKGRNSYTAANYFNNDVKKVVYKVSKPGYYINQVVTYTASKATYTIDARLNSTDTVKATGTCPLRVIGGQKCLGTITLNLIFYHDGKILYKSTQRSLVSYNSFKGYYYYVRTTDTTQTTYTNGNTRKSVITTLYNRNSDGTLIGKKISGKSQGTEKINNKTVSYTGIITVGTKYDPRDFFNEYLNPGDYKEVLTSSSPTLLKVIPIEAYY